MKPEDQLNQWMERVPKEGADSEDLLAVMRYLGMNPEQGKKGHWKGKHQRLVGSVHFPYGIIIVNCHAFGKQGCAHPDAIRDIVRAARILNEENDIE